MGELEPEEDESEFEVDSTCYHNSCPESWTYEGDDIRVSYERSEPQKIDEEPVPRKKERSVAYIINHHPV